MSESVLAKGVLTSGVDHLAVKVEDLDGAVKAFLALGWGLQGRRRHPEVGMEVAFLELGGNRLELLQSLEPTSPIARDPPGPHHLALECPAFQQAFETLCADDRFQVLGPPRAGAHGRPVFFLRAKAAGMLLELVSREG